MTSPGSVELVQGASPPLVPGSVRVAVEGCGVCGSNLPAWEGRPWFDYPLRPGNPGHEAWGRVVEGRGEGTRVALLAEDAFTDELVVPADRLVPLPPELDGQPFPGEAIGCAFNAARRSGFEPGQTVAVVGVGFLGALLVALAAAAGCRVVAVARKESALQVARQMGAAETVLMDDHARVIDEVAGLTGGTFCERVVEGTGAPWPLDLSGELTGFGGRLVIAGFHQDGLRSVNVQLWNWRGIDVVNAHERDPEVQLRGIRAAVDAVASGRLDPRPLYTHAFPLEDLKAAMDAAAERPEGFVKALVTS
ncbi:MAG TPA: zinc-binding dehydrogenase [Mycobacteriales bacterium]|nr:zinc-binding dehydrogenase [Mycobacteriales bacterium]